MTSRRTRRYFESMEKEIDQYIEAKSEARKHMEECRESTGWDSKETEIATKAYNEIESNDPFTFGAVKAKRAWDYTQNIGSKTIVMYDFLWEREIEDFCKTLVEAGVKTFYYTNHSTAVMENLHGFAKYGWKFAKPVEVERKGWRGETEIDLGIEFRFHEN